MRAADYSLNVLFPAARAAILRALFATPSRPRYVRELTRTSGLALRTIQEELSKLTAAGLITSWSNGYHRFYQPNSSHPFCPHLFRVVEESERGSTQSKRRTGRPRHSRSGKKLGKPAPRKLPPDRLIRWNLFSQPRKT